ncbi:hypothetical protein L2E82_50343 [Cichorium intybus]|nr:hypothetical protein L2E82_50343 [Cichorium intybus]
MRPPIATVSAVYSTSISVDEVSGDEVSAIVPPPRVLHFRREIVAKFLNPAVIFFINPISVFFFLIPYPSSVSTSPLSTANLSDRICNNQLSSSPPHRWLPTRLPRVLQFLCSALSVKKLQYAASCSGRHISFQMFLEI